MHLVNALVFRKDLRGLYFRDKDGWKPVQVTTILGIPGGIKDNYIHLSCNYNFFTSGKCVSGKYGMVRHAGKHISSLNIYSVVG